MRCEVRTRFYSYALVLGIHVAKQWDVDYVGFAHEYGTACVEPVHGWHDARLIPAALLLALHVGTGAYFCWRHGSDDAVAGCVLFLVYLAWSSSLFPISGIVKVGTFIADRIVVASTVPVAILQAYAAATWIAGPAATTAAAAVPKQQIIGDDPIDGVCWRSWRQ